MNCYIIYYRVSTKKQGESGLGLDAQRSYVEHYYKDKNIIAEFVEVRSGKTISKRPELQKALALCQAERATLVVAKIDRLSRNTEQALLIHRELEGRLESCDIPNLDKFTLTLFMAIADRERELIGLRTKQALDQKRIRVGEWRTGGPNAKKAAAGLIGAQTVKEMASENENSRRATALIESLRKGGLSYPVIAEQLNLAGFKTPRGKTFIATQVRRLHQRPVTTTSIQNSELMQLKTYQRENRTYMAPEYYQYLYDNGLLVDGSAGGLVQGPSLSEGGIQMIHMNRDAEVFIAQKVEGWAFLINAFASRDFEIEISTIARPYKFRDNFFLPYVAPPSINTIVITPKEVDGMLVTPYLYFGTNVMGVLNKQVAKENLIRLNEMNMLSWQTHFTDANPTPTIRDSAVIARFTPKNDN